MDIDDLIDEGNSNSIEEEADIELEDEIDQDSPNLSNNIPQRALAMFSSDNFNNSTNGNNNCNDDNKKNKSISDNDNTDDTDDTDDIVNKVLGSLGDRVDKDKDKDKGKLPWVEKYRPANLDELIDHKEKIDTIRNFIKNNEFPHLLLYGPPGTGKTSLIQTAAKEMYGDDYKLYILELNASDHRGIETIRSKIPNFVRIKSDKIRLVILDEADAMTSEAQGALRRTMEKYIKICRFCIICNKVNKIIPGLQSRTSQMRFGMLDAKSIEPRIREIAAKEGVKINNEAIRALIELQKDFRQIINTLQCLHYVRIGEAPTIATGGSYPIITAEYIHKYLGKPSKQEITDLVHEILSKPFSEIYEKMQQIYRDNKWNPIDLIQRINNFVIDSPAFTEDQKSYLTQKFSKLEFMIVNGRDTEIQLAALIGILKKSLIKYRK